jgi:hypothetical protein
MTTSRKDDGDRSRERELALAVVAGLLMRERRTVRALIRAERRALVRLRRAVAAVLDNANASLDMSDTRRALATIRRTAPRLAHSLEQAIISVRTDARLAARGTVLREIGSAAFHPLDGRIEHDVASAHATATSYASAGSSRVSATVLHETPPEGVHPFRTNAHDARLERIAATENAGAFNDERRRIFDSLDDDSRFKVWSAILDRVTCRYCFGKDGEVRQLHESFGATPPVHPNCRCVISLLSLPKPERLEDVSMDYHSLKSEIRDVIRERREVSGRHAVDFLTESMGDKRSPLALTRRFRERRHERP